MNYKDIIQLLTSDPDKLDAFFKGMMDTHRDDEGYWAHILENLSLDSAFIKEHYENINFKYLFKYQKLDDDMLCWLRENVTFYPEDLANLVRHQKLSVEMLDFYIDKMYPMDWDALARFQDLPSELIDKYADKWDWDVISLEQYLTLETIEKYSDKINWVMLPLNYQSQYLFNDSFVHFFQDKPIWDNIGMLSLVSVDCLMFFKDKLTEDAWYSILIYKEIDSDKIQVVIDALPVSLDQTMVWDSLSTHQVLSRELIERHADRLNWDHVSAHQPLDWDMISKFHERISLYYLSRNDCLTATLIAKIEENADLFKDTLDKELLSE